jgi:hypothetical protein
MRGRCKKVEVGRVRGGGPFTEEMKPRSISEMGESVSSGASSCWIVAYTQ